MTAVPKNHPPPRILLGLRSPRSLIFCARIFLKKTFSPTFLQTSHFARHDPEVEFDKETSKRRSIVEQSIGWLKECRRIGTRFEKLAINFLAMVKIAMVKRTLKLVFSNRA